MNTPQKNKMKQTMHAKLFAISALCFVFVMGISIIGIRSTNHALAEGPIQYVPLAPLPGIGDNGQPVSSLPVYLSSMFRLLIGAAAALAVLMITIGGIQYMSTDSLSGKSEGRHKIEQALLGLLLAISSWLILNTVNPKTLEFNFNPEPIGSANECAAGQHAVVMSDGTTQCQN